MLMRVRSQNGKGPSRGLSFSGPVSRILSKATICLIGKGVPMEPPKRPCGLPGPRRAGSTVLLGLAPGGVCLAAASPRRRCALTAPFHLCLYATHVWPRHRPCHFCGTFPRVSPGGRYPPPCPVVSGLSSRGFLSPRGRSARPPMVARWMAPAKRSAAMVAGMRTAVVTGAGSGLGRAIAIELAERGYRVHVTDVDAGAADRVAAELGGEARGSALDVRDEIACRGLADSIGRTGSLDLWVNTAGVFFSGPPWEQSAETRQTMLDVNVTGLMNGTIAALGPMRNAGAGHVVNIVSLAGIVAAPGEVAYSASKHAAMAFTLGTLFDLRRGGHDGIELSAVCPDGIWTPMLEDKLDDLDSAASFSGHLLTAEEVAAQVGKLTERPRPILIVPR